MIPILILKIGDFHLPPKSDSIFIQVVLITYTSLFIETHWQSTCHCVMIMICNCVIFCVTRSWFGNIVWKSFEKIKVIKAKSYNNGKSNRTQNNHFENSSKDGLHFLFVYSCIAHDDAGTYVVLEFYFYIKARVRKYV